MEVTLRGLDDLPVGGLRMVRADGKRLVVIRTSEGLFALDNACPHEGYGLVQGDVNDGDGTLTCAWHNWKFRVADGRCLLGEEDVRSYPIRVEGDTIHADVTDPDPEVLRPRLLESLRRAIEENYVGQTARDVIRLLRADADPVELLWEAIQWGAPRTEFGWGHALATATDCLALLDRYEGDQRAHPIVQGIAGIAEAERRRPIRHMAPPATSLPSDIPSAFRDAVDREDVATAEGLVLGALEAGAGPDVLQPALIGAVTDHHLSYGHMAIYTQKAFALLDGVGWDRAPVVLGHLPVAYVIATREDKLPYMRPFLRALAGIDLAALAERGASPEPGWSDDGGRLAGALLARPKTAPVPAAVQAIDEGAGVEGVLDSVVLAGSERLLRYDNSIDFDLHDDFGWLDITHVLTYAHAARWAWRTWPSPDTLRLAFFAAFQCHYSGRAEWRRPAGPSVPPVDAAVGDVAAAIEDRRAGDAVAFALGSPFANVCDGLERAALADRAGSFIVAAHLVKTSHAAVAEATSIGSPVPLAAAARFAAAPRLERFVAESVARSIDFLSGRGPADMGGDDAN
jgi:nitrite reductase/ring-hydroxylating ferredoxin subunit